MPQEVGIFIVEKRNHMNILYLHGLDSKLSPEKKRILEKFGEVVSPEINYYEDPQAIQSILKEMQQRELDVVLGTSIGGFAGYYVSTALKKPALLFNPALKQRSVEQATPSFEILSPVLKQFVIGAGDEVVIPADSMEFLSTAYNNFTNFHLHLRPGLGHNIPLDVFEEEVTFFFDLLKL